MKLIAAAVLVVAVVIAVVGWRMSQHRASCGGTGIYQHCSR